MQEVARHCAERPAQIYGQYPQKGAIAVGSDADLTIIDMNREFELTAANMLSKVGFTTWEGIVTRGAAVYTIVRGAVVMKDGEVVGSPGYGRFTPGVAARETTTAAA